MNKIQIFTYGQNDVRTVQRDGEPWFVLKDICEVLGINNHKNVSVRLDGDEKGVCQMDTLGGSQEMTIISESGLYNVILRSDKPEAKPFRKWVTSEVLPSIRKHGAYMTPDTLDRMISSPEFGIKLLTALQEEQKKNRALMLENEAMQPKALFADAVSASHTSILIGDLAKLIKQNGVDIGQKRLFGWLRDNGYLVKQRGASWNMPTQRSMEMKLFDIKETAVNHADGHVSVARTVKVTGKGQLYFVEKFLGKK